MVEPDTKRVIIIGGGPAGLTAAYELCKADVASVVLEKDSTIGGLSRTVSYKGYHFDIGGHRFFTKVRAVDELWREVLPNGDFLRRRRLSRIYYNKRFLHYPLRLSSALFHIGILNGLPQNIYSATSQTIIDVVYEHFNRTGTALFFASNNLAVPARGFRSIGGFDERFITSEDRDLCDRWLGHGYKMEYAPEALIHHAHTLTLRTLWR